MPDSTAFYLTILAASAAGLAVLAASRFTDRLKVPLPAVLLALAAVVAHAVPGLRPADNRIVPEVVSVALVAVLFDGGMRIGWSRFRSQAGPILTVGVLGTFGTAAAGAVVARYALGVDWYAAVLLATAVSPTDPAVVFSVLGRRQLAGGSGTLLEGESGANDPVGIALMAALIAGGGVSASGAVHALGTFALQMGVGAAVGYLGGKLLLLAMRRLSLPDEGLYPLRTLAGAYLLYGAASAAHGSGFLAVFVAGIVLGDERAPYKREIEHFHGAVSSLGELVAFAVLGLTIDVHLLGRVSTWLPGLAIGAALALVIRPLVVGACLARSKLSGAERRFVQFAGLKGAVPILLGSYIFSARVASPARLYEIVVVVVAFSVLVQGGLVGPVARRLGLPVHLVLPEPWTLGVRLRDEPQNVHRVVVAPGAPADGAVVAELPGLPEDAWVSLLVREGQLLPVRGSTTLRAGDQLTVLADRSGAEALRSCFEGG
ncbi:MAG TPA: cation:proton antiporter [Acidimicrobiales bacterium]|nr:cation:proton antiporter [Acidimicrobiales bacterium]